MDLDKGTAAVLVPDLLVLVPLGYYRRQWILLHRRTSTAQNIFVILEKLGGIKAECG
jgi:hypothetical protein